MLLLVTVLIVFCRDDSTTLFGSAKRRSVELTDTEARILGTVDTEPPRFFPIVLVKHRGTKNVYVLLRTRDRANTKVP